MGNTGDLHFQPVLHNITADEVIFCYRAGDADSLDVAEYYKSARGLDADHLIPLPCGFDNIIIEQEYIDTIETPLLQKLNKFTESTSASSGSHRIWVIILGYHIPHAYYVDNDPYGETIAIASRLHRLGKNKSYKFPNFVYDRKSWSYFDQEDASEFYITAIIDGPSVLVAKRLIDRSVDIDNQLFVTGSIYVDPFGKQDTESQLKFQSDVLEFVSFTIPNMGMDHKITAELPGEDPMVHFFKNDSFYWGWYTPRYSSNLFINQNERRVFLYNADDDSASDLSNDLSGESDPWCNIAINIEPGYAACGGAVSAPGEDAYLRARPFFESLQRGASLGESFLFASPYVDWKIVLIGDPLLVINFPANLPPELDLQNTKIPNKEVIRRTKNILEDAIAWQYRQPDILEDLIEFNYKSSNVSEQLPLMYHLKSWYQSKSISTRNQMLSPIVSKWITYILNTEGTSLQSWLETYQEKASSYLNNVIETVSNKIPDNLVHPLGHWEYEFVYTHPRKAFEDVFFNLQISDSNTFATILANINSYTAIGGWRYESEPHIFVQIGTSGVPSNYSGRRIKYTSQESDYLTSLGLYYIRWRAWDSNGSPIGDWNIDSIQKIISR
jgi:uncharacterized protein (TIGR03790 family)